MTLVLEAVPSNKRDPWAGCSGVLASFCRETERSIWGQPLPGASLWTTAPVSVRDEQPCRNGPDCTEQLGVIRR